MKRKRKKICEIWENLQKVWGEYLKLSKLNFFEKQLRDIDS